MKFCYFEKKTTFFGELNFVILVSQNSTILKICTKNLSNLVFLKFLRYREVHIKLRFLSYSEKNSKKFDFFFVVFRVPNI